MDLFGSLGVQGPETERNWYLSGRFWFYFGNILGSQNQYSLDHLYDIVFDRIFDRWWDSFWKFLRLVSYITNIVKNRFNRTAAQSSIRKQYEKQYLLSDRLLTDLRLTLGLVGSKSVSITIGF